MNTNAMHLLVPHDSVKKNLNQVIAVLGSFEYSVEGSCSVPERSILAEGQQIRSRLLAGACCFRMRQSRWTLEK